MKEAMEKYLRMGTVHFMTYPSVLSDESQVVPTLKRLIADPYFSVLEVAHIKDESIRAMVTELFSRTDCALIFAAQPEQLGKKININATDPTERKAAIDTLKRRIDEAYAMKAEGFGFIAGRIEEGRQDEQFELLVDACHTLCEYAESQGDMPIELEQFDCDIQNRLLIGSATRAKKLANALGDCANFGILVDLSHLPLLKESPKECFDILGSAVTHVHIGNAVCSKPDDYLYGDFHPRFSLPNSAVGVPEVADFLRELFAIGYFGEGKRPIVSFEIKAWPPDDCEAVLAECKRVMNQAWALL